MGQQNIITVDWEDWFHICEVDDLLPRSQWHRYPSILPEATELLLDFFRVNNVSATFFILGYCAKRFPQLVQKIAKAGHELAYHSQEHELVYNQTIETFRRDITEGKQELEELAQQEVMGFRAPQWSLNERCPWGLEELARAGYRYDSSHSPLTIIGDPSYPEIVHNLQTPLGTIQEFPPLILNIMGLKVPAGGGWGLKTWPLPAIKKKMKRLNQAGSPATFFIHPAELIPFKRPVQLPFLKRMVTGFGIRQTISALESLLAESELISIRTYMEQTS